VDDALFSYSFYNTAALSCGATGRELADQVKSDNVTLCLLHRNIQSSIFFFFLFCLCSRSNCRRKSIDERKELFSLSSLLYCARRRKKERGGARKRLSGSQLCVNPHTHTHDSNIYPHQTKGARAPKKKKNR